MGLRKGTKQKEAGPQRSLFELFSPKVQAGASPEMPTEAAPVVPARMTAKVEPVNSENYTWAEWHAAKAGFRGPTKDFVEIYGEEPSR